MLTRNEIVGILMSFSMLARCAMAQTTARAARANPYTAWTHGPSHSADYFPIAVWLQAPQNAQKFKAAGINTYVGLWQGPTEQQLAELKQTGMKVICDQNAVGLKHLDDDTIIAWMHGDEPDNAQQLPNGSGYGPPVAPDKIIADYQRIRQNDPKRPVMLNLGQGVAWDGWYGRGVRTNHPEDYPEYLKGCDIASFDIYPAVHDRAEVAGKLWYVPQGVDRLRRWSGDEKIVWNCIECTRISNTKVKPTPRQVEAEVWMSLIHGSRGLIYFVHQFQPNFVEAALLTDPEMLLAVTKINRQITELAPVLNSPSITSVNVSVSDPAVPVDVMMKRYNGFTYVFAVAMRDGTTQATISVADLANGMSVEVLDEARTVPSTQGSFTDRFQGYQVHRYRVSIGK